jgi:hypothetical protein
MDREMELHKAAGRLGIRRKVDDSEGWEKKAKDLRTRREEMRKRIRPDLYQV